jgi:hypothetical protein
MPTASGPLIYKLSAFSHERDMTVINSCFLNSDLTLAVENLFRNVSLIENPFKTTITTLLCRRYSPYAA